MSSSSMTVFKQNVPYFINTLSLVVGFLFKKENNYKELYMGNYVKSYTKTLFVSSSAGKFLTEAYYD